MASDNKKSTLEGAIFDLLVKQSSSVFLPITGGACLLGLMVASQAPVLVWLPWVLLVISMLIFRRQVLIHLSQQVHFSDATRLTVACFITAAAGCGHGLAASLFIYTTPLEWTVITIYLIAIASGSVATLAGYPKLFLPYISGVIPVGAVTWGVAPGLPATGPGEWFMAIGSFLFGFLLIGLSRDIFRQFKESYYMRFEQADLNEKLENALALAEQANQAKTRFFASASHDLRQPLHTVSLFGAALSVRELDIKTRQIVSHMNDAVGSLSSQLDSLLDISKLDAGAVYAEKEIVDIAVLIARIAKNFIPQADAKNLQLQVSGETHLICHTDPQLLERIINNLVANAIKFTEQGAVLLSAQQAHTKLEIIIEDSGIGMPTDEQSRVFEEFYQLGNPGRDRQKGMGLGLSIVKRLCNLLDTELKLTSKPGKGTTFSLAIPRELLHKPTPTATPEETIWVPKKVLVIDDEESVREGMRTLLEHWDCSVATAANTAEALDAVCNNCPDIAVSDYRLGDNENGVELIDRLRIEAPGLPALLISGDSSAACLSQAHAANLKLLHKPLPPEQLKRAISDACDV